MLGLTVELLLQPVRIELGEHRFERHAHAGQHRDLMIPQVGKRIFERFDRPEVGGIPLHQQVVERVVDVGGKLERVVLGRPESRHAHAELVLDLLARSHDIHDAGHHHAQDLTEGARELRRDVGGIQSRALQHGRQITARLVERGRRPACEPPRPFSRALCAPPARAEQEGAQVDGRALGAAPAHTGGCARGTGCEIENGSSASGL